MNQKVSRLAKDHVFVDMFNQKKYCLELFNTLHPEMKDISEDDIANISISHVIVDRPYNDLGFTVRGRLLVLVEAQSKWSYNILLRILLYLADTYTEIIHNHENWDVHATSKLPIPPPEFYVIYTGDQSVPEKISLRRDFFQDKNVPLDLEARVINTENTDDIIGQYIIYAHVFDQQVRKYGRERIAIEETIRICKSRGALIEYLTSHEKEVVDSMVMLFEQEFAVQRFGNRMKAEGEAEGEAKAEAKAMERDKRRVLRMYERGDTLEKIAENMDLPLEQIKNWTQQ